MKMKKILIKTDRQSRERKKTLQIFKNIKTGRQSREKKNIYQTKLSQNQNSKLQMIKKK